MHGVTGSPASFCDLIVSSFPDDISDVETCDFVLSFLSESKRHYYLRDNCHLNVYKRSEITDRWFPKSVFNDSSRNSSEALYFEIRGPISVEALLQLDRFLELYSSDSYFGTEREIFLEQTDTQSVHLLQDISRVALLRYLWSEMNFEDAETLQGVLYSSLALTLKPFWTWLKGVDQRRIECRNRPGCCYSEYDNV